MIIHNKYVIVCRFRLCCVRLLFVCMCVCLELREYQASVNNARANQGKPRTEEHLREYSASTTGEASMAHDQLNRKVFNDASVFLRFSIPLPSRSSSISLAPLPQIAHLHLF